MLIQCGNSSIHHSFYTYVFRYGDKTPSTVGARLFAVFWILVGVTVFNMNTASLTSVLTNTFNQDPHSFVGKHVCLQLYSLKKEKVDVK